MQHSMTTNALSRATWRMVCAFIVALLAGLMLTQKAEADSIRVACQDYATNQFDPIGHATHLHRQIGNTSLNNNSTYESLYANKATSCESGAKWWTNAGWFPVEGNANYFEPVGQGDIYYRGPEADDSTIRNFPNGLQLIARNTAGNTFNEIVYNCGAGPGNTTPKQATPPYSCTDNWATEVTFPRCYDGSGVLTHEHTVYGPNRQSCPTDHPYRIPEISYVITHPNADGFIPNPLRVSGDDRTWLSYTSMHADYFFAAQDEFSRALDLNGDGRIQDNAGTASYTGGYSESSLMDLCIRKAPESLEFNNARCRAGGLLAAHQRAINNYYN
jgi:Domain of unknown function (DUF1996)